MAIREFFNFVGGTLYPAKKGKITLLRESLNTVAAAQALNPNGVADLPLPESEIFSVPPDYLS